MYAKIFKRFFDIILSFIALCVLSPILIIFTVLGAIVMKGNPFFTQQRPGKNEKIFKLIKFRTMTFKKDKEGKLLPDKDRMTKYGKILRATSIDELPELLNILVGHMSFIGPRPLAVIYLPYYTEEEKHRHDVRPGLTGLAQVNGRNAISWENKFKYDVEYVNNITFANDVRIIFKTIYTVFKRENIGQGEERPTSLHIERAQIAKEETVKK